MIDLTAQDLLFLVLAGIIIVASLWTVFAENPVRATFFLIVSFLPTAGIYMMLHAPLAGLLQVLVYTGAILVLFTFVVMMINPSPGPSSERLTPPPYIRRTRLLAALASLAIAGSGLWLVLLLPAGGAVEVQSEFGSVRAIGRLLFENPLENPHTISLQMLGLLILGGIILAVNLSRGRNVR
ncbi:MAG: NADH-quinone oxidoreductase subunit J [Leptospirales bacterium]|nr:NADH-quinone oxidoreductase subunit J [Leptospirales bacterium]